MIVLPDLYAYHAMQSGFQLIHNAGLERLRAHNRICVQLISVGSPASPLSLDATAKTLDATIRIWH